MRPSKALYAVITFVASSVSFCNLMFSKYVPKILATFLSFSKAGICVSRPPALALNLLLPALVLNLCLPVLRFTVKICYSYSVYLYKLSVYLYVGAS